MTPEVKQIVYLILLGLFSAAVFMELVVLANSSNAKKRSYTVALYIMAAFLLWGIIDIFNMILKVFWKVLGL